MMEIETEKNNLRMAAWGRRETRGMMETAETEKNKVRFGSSEKNTVMYFGPYFKTVEDLEASDPGMMETDMEKNLHLEPIGFAWTHPAIKMRNKLRFGSSAKNKVRFFGPYLETVEESEIGRRLATDRMIKGLIMRLESMIMGLESMMLGLDWLEKVVVQEYTPENKNMFKEDEDMFKEDENMFEEDMTSGIVTLKLLIDEYTHMVVEGEAAAGSGEEIFSPPLKCETSSKYLEMFENFRWIWTHAWEGEDESTIRNLFLSRMMLEIDMLKRAVSKEYTHIPGCKTKTRLWTDDQEPLVKGETAGKNIFQEGMRSGIDMLKILIREYTYMVEGGTGDDGWPC